MASDGHWQPPGFEDQLRRMILHENQSAATPQSSNPHGQPTVRLPPTGQYSPQQQFYGNSPTRAHHGPRYPFHARNASSPKNQYGPMPGPINYPMQPGPPGQGIPHRGYYAPHERAQQHHPGFQQMHQSPQGSPVPHQRARSQQPMALDPNAFHRSGLNRPLRGRGGGAQQLFNPNQPRQPPTISQADRDLRQIQYLEQVASVEVRNVEMSLQEHTEKVEFRVALGKICHEVCAADPQRLPVVSLEPFGSFRSGFATAGSDMDLVIVIKDQNSDSSCFSLLEDDLPRALEKRLLDLGYGARLLTRTRVPIIKVCQSPGGSLLDKLREERWKWNDLPNEKKYPHLHSGKEEEDEAEADPNAPVGSLVTSSDTPAAVGSGSVVLNGSQDAKARPSDPSGESAATNLQLGQDAQNGSQQPQREDLKREEKLWSRERKAGPLDFPKTGVGIQCDINFFNPLGLHNTELLRCYSLCDPRVRPIVLFIKAWAKKRKINSSYSGTLSSYGYVLMVLHYLVNIVQPPVLPNLQLAGEGEIVDGWNVHFQRNEKKIVADAARGELTSNHEPLGALLTGFFQYYSSQSGYPSFHWMQNVLSLRSTGGILSKENKGWTKAITEESEGKKVQHRYLFCIEDPFEMDHNVARTVTHNGIVAIRDEFRRANRILTAIGNEQTPRDGELFAELIEVEDTQKTTIELKKANANGLPNGPVDGSYESRRGSAAAAAYQNMSNAAANKRAHNLQEQKRLSTQSNQRGGKRGGHAPSAPNRALNVDDSEAFPNLGGAKPSKKKASRSRDEGEEFSEISGEKAKAYLEEVKRMKDEAQAESTATGAAEAVLSGID